MDNTIKRSISDNLYHCLTGSLLAELTRLSGIFVAEENKLTELK